MGKLPFQEYALQGEYPVKSGVAWTTRPCKGGESMGEQFEKVQLTGSPVNSSKVSSKDSISAAGNPGSAERDATKRTSSRESRRRGGAWLEDFEATNAARNVVIGLSYTGVSAGRIHTVLLRSNGSVVACGANSRGQCNIPPLDEGMSYTQISADGAHTALLRSDGRVVACGGNNCGQCNIPPLDEGLSYTQVSAGGAHTALLCCDGRVVACGANGWGQCNIPPLDEGLSYTQVSAGGFHTVLLRSDGHAVACGASDEGQCNVPPLDEGMSYAQVSAGDSHTVLLRSDGSDAVMLTCSSLAGCEVLCLKAHRSDLVSETHQRIARELVAPLRSVHVVLPGGRLLAAVWHANPSATLADVMLGEEFGS
eukprot:s9_g62.t1